jgi:fructosamine-3-kinase
MHLSREISNRLLKTLGDPSPHWQSVGGGSINETYRITTAKGSFFCKMNSAVNFPQLFRLEANGLAFLDQQQVIRIPEVIDHFELNGQQVLLLEWISSGERTDHFWKNFGRQLAFLHMRSSDHFGLNENNYMGAVPQDNSPSADWTTFFRDKRLHPLVSMCHQRSLLQSRHVTLFEKFYGRLQALFEPEPPSLLHGDLWSGNFMCDQHAEPVLIDPAVYYGHRSMDLAMTTLFGGFQPAFYEAYHFHFPFSSNYREQWEAANLYPLLIHLLLFGKSYLRGIEEKLMAFG